MLYCDIGSFTDYPNFIRFNPGTVIKFLIPQSSLLSGMKYPWQMFLSAYGRKSYINGDLGQVWVRYYIWTQYELLHVTAKILQPGSLPDCWGKDTLQLIYSVKGEPAWNFGNQYFQCLPRQFTLQYHPSGQIPLIFPHLGDYSFYIVRFTPEYLTKLNLEATILKPLFESREKSLPYTMGPKTEFNRVDRTMLSAFLQKPTEDEQNHLHPFIQGKIAEFIKRTVARLKDPQRQPRP
jgi:hypothetical protein